MQHDVRERVMAEIEGRLPTLLAPHPTRDDAEQRIWDLNWKILVQTVLEEDFPVGETMQRAFASGAQEHVTFGRDEPALQHLHRSLADALGPLPTA